MKWYSWHILREHVQDRTNLKSIFFFFLLMKFVLNEKIKDNFSKNLHDLHVGTYLYMYPSEI